MNKDLVKSPYPSLRWAAILAFVFPLICYWVPYGLPLFLISLNLVLLLKLKAIYFAPLRRIRGKGWMIGGVSLGWMLLSCLWAPDLLYALRVCGTMGGLSLLAFLGSQSIHHLRLSVINDSLRGFAWGFWISLVLASIDMLTYGHLHHLLGKGSTYLSDYNRGLTLLIFFIPLGLYSVASFYPASKKAMLAAWAAFGLFLLSSANFDFDAGVLALGVMPLIFFLFYKGKRKLITFTTLIVACLTLTAPLIPKYILTYNNWHYFFPQTRDASWLHRLYIWSYVSQKIFEHPLKGWGINSARSTLFQEKLVWTAPTLNPDSPGITKITPSISLHPHNIALQVWLELGAVGACLLTLIIGMIGHSLGLTAYGTLARTCLATMFSTTLIFGSLSYGIWQSWWYASICIAFIGSAFIQLYEKIGHHEK